VKRAAAPSTLVAPASAGLTRICAAASGLSKVKVTGPPSQAAPLAGAVASSTGAGASTGIWLAIRISVKYSS
jgi:hypothetical protein